MPNAVAFYSYKLKDRVHTPDFLAAADRVNSEYMSKQKGFISWKVLSDGETWLDLLTWETMEDAHNAANGSRAYAFAAEYFAFMDFDSLKAHYFTVENSYQSGRTPVTGALHMFKLKDGASADHTLAADKLCAWFPETHKTVVSFDVFSDGEMWADLVIFDSKNNQYIDEENPLIQEYFSFGGGSTAEPYYFAVMKNYSQ